MMLVTLVGLSLAGLSLWATDAQPDKYVGITTPTVYDYQFGLIIDGPSPDITVVLYSQSVINGKTVEHLRFMAPRTGLFVSLGCVIVLMLSHAINGNRTVHIVRRVTRFAGR